MPMLQESIAEVQDQQATKTGKLLFKSD